MATPSIERLDQWRRLYQQKRHEFTEEQCTSVARIQTMDGLQQSLREMSSRYGLRRLPTLVQSLQPTLINVKSFTQAISSAAQYEPIACLVWGGMQAVLECACKASDMLEETINLLGDLNNALPRMEEYIALFPGHIELQWPIQDLYDDYLGYCVILVRYLKNRPSLNILQYLWSSSPRSALKNTKTKITQHIEEFETEVKLVDRKTVRRHNIEMTKSLAAPLETLESKSGAAKQDAEKANFPISTVSMYRNYTFVGRDTDLKKMRDLFLPHLDNPDEVPTDESSQMREPKCCILHGIGGVGKTQAALEYSYVHRKLYDAIFWLPAERDVELREAFASIARLLCLVPASGADSDHPRENIDGVRKWLENTERSWLLIFDNMEDVSDLAQYFPTSCRGTSSVIMTTQNAQTYPITKDCLKVEIQSFGTEDGSSLLFKYLEREPANADERQAADEIVEFVGGLPLAIAAIGGYVNQSRSQVQGFLKSLKVSSKVWTASAVGPAKQYEKTLRSVFSIAFAEIPQRTREFLNVLAFLDPDCIPEQIFTAHFKEPILDCARNEYDFVEDIRVLRRRQLIRRDNSPKFGPFLSIHRTVQQNVLLDISENEQYRWQCFRNTMTLLRQGCPMVSPLNIPEPEKWPDFEKYVPQVLNVRSHCLWPEPPIEPPVDFADLLSDLGTYMWHAGLADAGQDALETVLDVYDKENVAEHDERRSNVYSKLGILISFNGVSSREETMEYRMKAWNARHAVFNSIPANKVTREDEMNLFTVKSDLAYTHWHEENFEDVEKIMTDCLQQYKKWETEEERIPFEYGKYYHLMAFVRLWQGKQEEAVDFARRGADLFQKGAGIGHPMTQLWRFSFGCISYHTGQVQRAWEIMEGVRKDRIQICGEYNHYTLESYSTCAALLTRLDRLDEAEQLLKQCLEKRKRYAWNIEEAARAYFRLGQVLKRQNKPDEAKPYADEAARIRQIFVKKYSGQLHDDPDEELVFDQMVSLWAGRFTGKLRDGIE